MSSTLSVQLFAYPGSELPSTVPDNVRVATLPATPAEAARAFAEVPTDVDVIACWDFSRARFPWSQLNRFVTSLDDAWHPGGALVGADPDLLRYVIPLWVNRPQPARDVIGAINWRLDFHACFLRASVVRALGGLDEQFESLAGCARELGLRLVGRGAIVRQQPAMWTGATVEGPSPSDRYRLVGRKMSRKWQTYSLVRSILDGGSPITEARAWYAARGDRPRPRVDVGALHRSIDRGPLDAAVSIVLPTCGRYRYLAEVLEDIRAQTIRPVQIVICDGNPPPEREPAFYDQFRDLPIEVIWDERVGMCSARNGCIERATGDYIWFVDDDSRFAPDNLESHLRVLATYGADVSVGPAYTRGRPELHADQREIACTFMDCGTTLCKRELLERTGGFDMQFNTLLPGEDGELGVRFVRAGGVMVNNPLAKRFHYLAPVGGGRRSANNLHRWSRWSLMPRPVETVFYTARRHFEPGVEWDATLLASIAVGWRRREGEAATRTWRVRTALAEMSALPLTAYRMYKSVQIARRKLAEGAGIPAFSSKSTHSTDARL